MWHQGYEAAVYIAVHGESGSRTMTPDLPTHLLLMQSRDIEQGALLRVTLLTVANLLW